MKKATLTAMLIGLVSLSNFAFAANPSVMGSPGAMHHQMEVKDLKLTPDQAKTLVSSRLIKHGKTDAKIDKVDTANLANDKHFYFVYVSTKANSQSDLLFVVDAQSGRVVLFPSQFHQMKHHHWAMFHHFGMKQHQTAA